MPVVGTRTGPLKGKLVFLDTKAPVSKLRQQLEFLGARVETFFSKDIWCVITDKQVDEVNKKLLSSAANTNRQRTPFLNRTQVLLQAAQQKEAKKKKEDEVQTVIQECKQWDIPMLSIRTASSSVSKLLKKYQPVPEASSKKSSATNPLRKVVSESHLGIVNRLEGYEILKVEDKKQLYKPVYKVFTEQNYPRVKVSQPKSESGAYIGPFAREFDRLPQRATVGESRKNSGETTAKRSVADLKPGSRKRKLEPKLVETKSKYCELCHEYFTNLRKHLSSSAHVRAATHCAHDLEKIVGEFQNNFFEMLAANDQEVVETAESDPTGTSPKRHRVSNPERDISFVEV